MKFDEFLFSLSRPYKRLVSYLCDSLFITIAFWGSFFVRFGDLEYVQQDGLFLSYLGLLIISLLIFRQLGLYRSVLRFLTMHSIFVICLGVFLSSAVFMLIGLFSDILVPKSVPVIYFELLLILSGGSRLIVRSWLANLSIARNPRKRVLIYGAGYTGIQLCYSLRQSSDYCPVAFIDSNKALRKSTVVGLPVYSNDQVEKVIKKFDIDKVLLAIPRASRSDRQRIIEQLEPLSVAIRTVPDFEDIVSGRAKLDELRDVPIADLLGREPVQPMYELLSRNILKQVVMVTGAGGSIGSELCRQILQSKPSKLLLFEVSEYNLYSIEKELSELVSTQGLKVEVLPFLGSVQNKNRLAEIMRTFGVQTVYHAAAYKHVPMVEYNVAEGVQNNVFGTLYAAQAAISANVPTFVLVSTDKAVRPTNVMGASKRMAELCLQALAGASSNTRFCMVRFGNVLGSSGSVIPLFKKQIESGGPVTVTDENIIRYFMTIPEAAQLVIQAGAMGTGGDVFVLDMGEPVKITELARKLIKLSGLEVKDAQNPHGDIEIKFTGLRPGEKLYEELLIGDNVGATQHPRIMTANEEFLSWQQLAPVLNALDAACNHSDLDRVRSLLLNAPTGFAPTDGINDLTWNEKQFHVLSIA